MVIGPTPPGTGVMAPATFGRLRVSRRRRRACPCRPARMRLMPTSMTMAPGLIQSPRTISGRPTAATSDIGAAHDAGQVAGARMRDRHRAVLAQQQLRHRLADDVGAADDDRVEAGEVVLHRLRQDERSRAACRARARGSPVASRPTLIGWKPSTSLAGSIELRAPCWRRCAWAAAAARGCRRPLGSALRRVDESRAARPRASSAGSLCSKECMPHLDRLLAPCCARRPGSPDPRRPARPRGRA